VLKINYYIVKFLVRFSFFFVLPVYCVSCVFGEWR